MTKEKPKLTPENIRDIETVLAKDQTAEVKPTKDGVRVCYVERKAVKSAEQLR